MMWTLATALTVVRKLQPKIHKLEWHVVIGGGVINNGKSVKDLDLYFFPKTTGDSVQRGRVIACIVKEFANIIEPLRPDCDHYEDHLPFTFSGKVMLGKKRIDVFIL